MRIEPAVRTASTAPASSGNSILRQVSNQEPIGTGVGQRAEGELRQANFDPFAEVEQELGRVAQTPAPLHERPRENPKPVPSLPSSVVRDSAASPEVDEQTSQPRRSLIGYPVVQDQELPQQLPGMSDDDESQDGPSRRKSEKDCDEFRQQLLGQSLVDISLDISPPRRSTAVNLDAASRDWTDRNGNVLATGVMVNMVRGYIVVETAGGGQVRLPFARLSSADLQAIAATWQVPEECIVSTGIYPDRFWECQTVTWHASNLCHKPLYFENVNLERYGHTAGPVMQPLRSTGHFFVSLLTLPYHTAINPPNECIYALGYYRPGNCAPWLVDPFPISLAGAARQATFTTGAWYILP